jgi:hypothetical protein
LTITKKNKLEMTSFLSSLVRFRGCAFRRYVADSSFRGGLGREPIGTKLQQITKANTRLTSFGRRVSAPSSISQREKPLVTTPR